MAQIGINRPMKKSFNSNLLPFKPFIQNLLVGPLSGKVWTSQQGLRNLFLQSCRDMRSSLAHPNHTTPIQIYFVFVHLVAFALSLRYLMLVPGQLFTGPVNLGRFQGKFWSPICRVLTSLLLLARFIQRFAMSLV